MMSLWGSQIDAMVAPHLERMLETCLPVFREKAGDDSERAAKQYMAHLSDCHEFSIAASLFEIRDFCPEYEGMDAEERYDLWMGDVTESETSAELCLLEDPRERGLRLFAWIYWQMNLPPMMSEEVREETFLSKWDIYVQGVKTLVLATLLGRLSPNPDDYKRVAMDFASVDTSITDEMVERCHEEFGNRRRSFDDTLTNLECAYGLRPILEAPALSSLEAILDAGPLDETSGAGYQKMARARAVIGDIAVWGIRPMESVSQSAADESYYGDWGTPECEDVKLICELREKHLAEVA